MLKIPVLVAAPWLRAAAVFGLLATAACEDLPTGPGSAGGPLPGIDVSHWQGTVDWNTVAADGEEFAFIKATEAASRRRALSHGSVAWTIPFRSPYACRTRVASLMDTRTAPATPSGGGLTAFAHAARFSGTAGPLLGARLVRL